MKVVAHFGKMISMSLPFIQGDYYKKNLKQ